jgi:hypothetical protein
MSEFKPPSLPPDFYERNGAHLPLGTFILNFVVGTLLFGVFLGFIISVFSGPQPLGPDRMQREMAIFMTGFYISAPLALLIAWSEFKPALDNREAHRERFFAQAREEWERQRRHERLRATYAEKYQAYLPQWEAWRVAVKAYDAEHAAYEAWHEKFLQAWQAYRERGVKAAKLFETIHENVEKRGRLELELSSPEHLTALFREAIAAAAKTHPDLGILRLVDVVQSAHVVAHSPAKGPLTSAELEVLTYPKLHQNPPAMRDWQELKTSDRAIRPHRQVSLVVAYNLPELAYLFDDYRLNAVRDVLPPLPPLTRECTESRAVPKRPERPTSPEGVIFYTPSYGTDDSLPPVPPDKVKWS